MSPRNQRLSAFQHLSISGIRPYLFTNDDIKAILRAIEPDFRELAGRNEDVAEKVLSHMINVLEYARVYSPTALCLSRGFEDSHSMAPRAPLNSGSDNDDDDDAHSLLNPVHASSLQSLSIVPRGPLDISASYGTLRPIYPGFIISPTIQNGRGWVAAQRAIMIRLQFDSMTMFDDPVYNPDIPKLNYLGYTPEGVIQGSVADCLQSTNLPSYHFFVPFKRAAHIIYGQHAVNKILRGSRVEKVLASARVCRFPRPEKSADEDGGIQDI